MCDGCAEVELRLHSLGVGKCLLRLLYGETMTGLGYGEPVWREMVATSWAKVEGGAGTAVCSRLLSFRVAMMISASLGNCMPTPTASVIIAYYISPLIHQLET